MNQKKARRLRKEAGYKAGDDEIRDRQYYVLQTRKVAFMGETRRKYEVTGAMLACKEARLRYRQIKKQER